MSPVPIIAVILMLFSRRARVNGPVFLLGWVLALAVVSGVVYVVSVQSDAARQRRLGHESRGAQVRMGVLYRSVELNAERSAEPDVVPEGSVLVVCDVLEGSQSEAPAELTKVLADPSLAEQILGDGRAVARLRVTGARRTPLPGGKRSDPE